MSDWQKNKKQEQEQEKIESTTWTIVFTNGDILVETGYYEIEDNWVLIWTIEDDGTTGALRMFFPATSVVRLERKIL